MPYIDDMPHLDRCDFCDKAILDDERVGIDKRGNIYHAECLDMRDDGTYCVYFDICRVRLHERR